MKILRICNSADLPADRSSDYIYFVYDKMMIYLGNNYYSDPFCIVEKIPNNPINAMLYITYEGNVLTYLNNKVTQIGSIEDEKQLDYIKDAGSVYFMKAEYRYLDLQTRTIQLPFQNGSFQLSVNMTKEIMINENTIIKFDPKSNRFIIYGDEYYEDGNTPSLGSIVGKETNSITNIINGNGLKSYLRISNQENNLIKVLNDGVYINLSDKASLDELSRLLYSYHNYKSIVDNYIKELKNMIDDASQSISEDTINAKILQALEDYKPTIEDMFSNYESIANSLEIIKSDSKQYTDDLISSTKSDMENYLNQISNSWSNFEEPESGANTDEDL